LGVKKILCGECDVIFSYSYMNTTKLVLYVFILFSTFRLILNVFTVIDELFINIILAEICIKMRFFIEKLQKSPSAGTSPPDPQLPAAGGFVLHYVTGQ